MQRENASVTNGDTARGAETLSAQPRLVGCLSRLSTPARIPAQIVRMARKRDQKVAPPEWGHERLMRAAAAALLDADDAAIKARAAELRCDSRRLRELVVEARARRRSEQG